VGKGGAEYKLRDSSLSGIH